MPLQGSPLHLSRWGAGWPSARGQGVGPLPSITDSREMGQSHACDCHVAAATGTVRSIEILDIHCERNHKGACHANDVAGKRSTGSAAVFSPGGPMVFSGEDGRQHLCHASNRDVSMRAGMGDTGVMAFTMGRNTAHHGRDAGAAVMTRGLPETIIALRMLVGIFNRQPFAAGNGEQIRIGADKDRRS